MNEPILNRSDLDYTIEGQPVDQIVNYNEVQIIETLKKVLEDREDICKCSICVEDMYALSLNKLPPRYIQSTSLMKYKDSANYIDDDVIFSCVLESIEIVSQNMRHE